MSMQIPSHTSMHNRSSGIHLLVALLLLLAPAIARADVRIVPLSDFTKHSSFESQRVELSAATVSATMETVRYKGEGILSGMLSGSSKIDKMFSDDNSSPVFNSEETHALSKEISEAAAKLEAGQAIVFITHASRVKGYVFFSKGKSIWYLASIDGNPAHKVEQIEDPNYLPSDADSQWRNKLEKTYWTLVPQQGQSLLSGRRDLLMAPIAATAETAVAAEAPAPVAAQPAPAIANTDHWGRIERLHKLLERELISDGEYKEKLAEIINDFGQTHPAIEAQLDLLKQIREKEWMDEPSYQARRQKLLEKL